MKPDDNQKKNFIQLITSMDREQMARFIKEKGKEPKKIKPFVILSSKI